MSAEALYPAFIPCVDSSKAAAFLIFFCLSHWFYGKRRDEIVSETDPKGSGFLADVCAEWEGASRGLEPCGIRVVQARFGIVLSSNGGLLAKILPLFKWGLGGRWGSAEQWISWIALVDLIRALEFILRSETLQGVFNFVSPAPVSNEGLMQKIAKAVH